MTTYTTSIERTAFGHTADLVWAKQVNPTACGRLQQSSGTARP